jgi:hypothetical protein
VPVVAWQAAAHWPRIDAESLAFRRICRDLGYLSLAAILVPYLYVARRWFLFRPMGHMTRWMRWHIGASYLAFSVMVVHARGHLFRVGLSSWIVALFAVVVLTGWLGLLLQRVVFRLMALTLDEELGPERLEPQRRALIERADRLIANYSLLTVYDVRDWPEFCSRLRDELSVLGRKVWGSQWFPEIPRAIVARADEAGLEPEERAVVVEAVNELLKEREFCRDKDFDGLAPPAEVEALRKRPAKELSELEIERRNRFLLELAHPGVIAASRPPLAPVVRFYTEEVGRYLKSPFPSWGWLFGRSALEPVLRNHYLRVKALAGPEQAGLIDQLWDWVQLRRRMDLESWLHRLTHSWLVLHGPAALALLGLVALHVLANLYYGGFL